MENLEITERSDTVQLYRNCEIGQNTEKSPGVLKGIAVTQTPVKDH